MFVIQNTPTVNKKKIKLDQENGYHYNDMNYEQ